MIYIDKKGNKIGEKFYAVQAYKQYKSLSGNMQLFAANVFIKG